MKNLLILITIMLVGGCGKDKETPAKEITDLDLTPTLPREKAADTNATKPVKELTAEEKKIVGSYEAKVKSINPLLPIQLVTKKHIFLENGNYEAFNNGEAILGGKWKLVGKEVHVDYGTTVFYRIEANGDLTAIAEIREGKREVPLKKQTTYKKIK